ncbi:MAG: hypothetical protein ACJ76H_11675 [Bacteriovoracaceae bacterium]
MRYFILLSLLSFVLSAKASDSTCKGEGLINGFRYANAGYGDILPNGKIRGLRYLKDAVSFPFEYAPKSKYVELIQEFVNQKYGTAFKFLGDYMDFFHGHLLLEADKDVQKPVAILYHTQEFGYWNTDPSCKYLRFAPAERNWFQSLSTPDKIINAVGLPGRYQHEDDFLTHDTVHPEALDDENGHPYSNLEQEALQVSFFEASCSNIPEKFRTDETNFFTLNVQGETRCFLFTGAADKCGHPYTLDDQYCDQFWIAGSH